MKAEILKFIMDGIVIRKTDEGYAVFTVATQWFDICSLNELTEERFNEAIQDFEKREILSTELFQLHNSTNK